MRLKVAVLRPHRLAIMEDGMCVICHAEISDDDPNDPQQFLKCFHKYQLICLGMLFMADGNAQSHKRATCETCQPSDLVQQIVDEATPLIESVGEDEVIDVDANAGAAASAIDGGAGGQGRPSEAADGRAEEAGEATDGRAEEPCEAADGRAEESGEAADGRAE